MPSAVLGILILGAALLSISLAAIHEPKSCDEFSTGTSFSSSQAVGVWYLLHLRPVSSPDNDDRCVQFFTISDEERLNLPSVIGEYVKDMKWENLVLKMQIPCVGDSGHNNKTRDYYLEKLDFDGSYKTLPMPPPNTKQESIDRHAMRLKLVDGKYLAMMDCVEHFTFLLDKKKHDKLEPGLLQILQPFLPKEY